MQNVKVPYPLLNVSLEMINDRGIVYRTAEAINTTAEHRD